MSMDRRSILKCLGAGAITSLAAWLLVATFYSTAGKRLDWNALLFATGVSIPGIAVSLLTVSQQRKQAPRSVFPKYSQAAEMLAGQLLEDSLCLIDDARQQVGLPPQNLAQKALTFSETIDAYFPASTLPSESDLSDRSDMSTSDPSNPVSAGSGVGASAATNAASPEQLEANFCQSQFSEQESIDQPETISEWQLDFDIQPGSPDRDYWGDDDGSVVPGSAPYGSGFTYNSAATNAAG